MTHNRRTFLQLFSALFVNTVLARLGLSAAVRPQFFAGLGDSVNGSWTLERYTYTSDGQVYESPDQLEATVAFADGRYEVEFAAHIRRTSGSRTRRASESATFSVSGDRIHLFADKASSDDELGEEFLIDVRIADDTMSLTSNNGISTELWKKVP